MSLFLTSATKTRVRVLLVFTALAVSGLAVSVAGAAGAHQAKAKQVSVIDDAFKPTKVTIHKGGQVEWVWAKANMQPHNVTLLKAPKGVKKSKFDSPQEEFGGFHFTRSFKTPGIYHFECSIHPWMTFKVTVKK